MATKTTVTTTKAAPKKVAKKPAATGQIAVIETSGKQYLVHVGSTITTEKLTPKMADEKGTIVFSNVILTADTAAGTFELGAPYLKTTVTGTVMEEGKGAKIKVIKFKSKSNYHRSYGHRQPFTKIKITKIG